MKKPKLTLARLREVLDYDPATGIFRWKISAGSASPGKIAGSDDGHGYVKIRIDGVAYFAHRLAWLLMTGRWPSRLIDHEDRNGLNNVWTNLRLATYSQNGANTGLRKDNKLGVKGVEAAGDRFVVRFWANGKRHYFGSFNTLSEASSVAATKMAKIQGKFTRK